MKLCPHCQQQVSPSYIGVRCPHCGQLLAPAPPPPRGSALQAPAFPVPPAAPPHPPLPAAPVPLPPAPLTPRPPLPATPALPLPIPAVRPPGPPQAAPLLPPAPVSQVPQIPPLALVRQPLPGPLVPQPPVLPPTVVVPHTPAVPSAPAITIPHPISYPHKLDPLERWWQGDPVIVGVIKSTFERDSERPTDWAAWVRTGLLWLAALPFLLAICSTGGLLLLLFGGGACFLPFIPLFFGRFMNRRHSADRLARVYGYTVEVGSIQYTVEMYSPVRGAPLTQGQSVAFWGQIDHDTNYVVAFRAHAFEDRGRSVNLHTRAWAPTRWRTTAFVFLVLISMYVLLFAMFALPQ